MWTLLKQGFDGRPTVRKAVIVCPSSLVSNWGNEIEKWLKGHCPYSAVLESGKEKVAMQFKSFCYDRRLLVLIASYETFSLHVEHLKDGPIDLLICDEAHKLKNEKTRAASATNSLSTQRRLLLSGTPIQNDLKEFFALVSLANPAVFGDSLHFRKTFAHPILQGREPGATLQQQQLAESRLLALSDITNRFIIRRTNDLLAKHLPPKLMMNVFCNMAPIQLSLYFHYLHSSACRKVLKDSEEGRLNASALQSIQFLMKLCNHPSLISHRRSHEFIDFPYSDYVFGPTEGPTTKEKRAGAVDVRKSPRPELSGKFFFLYRLLLTLKKQTDEKCVCVSNFTQTLDSLQHLCKECCLPCVRLDGSISRIKRGNIVKSFNESVGNKTHFVFLLSSKAGGCGINLIGANRLVMFDPDWNPANDKQALARVWRDGQSRQCYIYRLFTTGAIEEKILQRQISKVGLSAMIVSDAELKNTFSAECLKDLFSLNTHTQCDTHDVLACTRCVKEDGGGAVQMEGSDFNEDDFNTWSHHPPPLNDVPDVVFLNALKLTTQLNQSDGDMCIPRELVTPPGFHSVSFVMSATVKYIEPSNDKEGVERKENRENLPPPQLKKAKTFKEDLFSEEGSGSESVTCSESDDTVSDTSSD
eukprot:GHVR01087545.1.p1 GENE.GHVR01087545.1~~GHVR01087545.1.p1  ORF type:complete len:643 (+),score=134.54 GHVR01087545.1:480-2408(+)